MCSKNNKGFTLIEVIFVTAIVALIVSIGAPITVDVYKDYTLNSENSSLISLLRRAKSLSISNNATSSFGLKINSNQFIVYRGSSFSTRSEEYDEEYKRSPSISISGLDEITFEPLTGFTKSLSTTTAVLENNGNSQTIIINPYGTIQH